MDKYKILIVDDEPDVRATMRGVLHDAGYEVQTASTPAEAFDLFIQHEFNFALIDVRLFGLGEDDNSGLTLGMTFKKLRPSTGIILFSAHKLTAQVDWAVRYHGILAIEKTPDMDQQILAALHEQEKQLSQTKDSDTGQPPSKSATTGKIQGYLQDEQNQQDISFSISLHNNVPIFIRARGGYVYSGMDSSQLKIDHKKYKLRAHQAITDPEDWRTQAKYLGEELWDEVFRQHSTVLSTYARAIGHNKRLSLYIETPREGLGLPLEFLRSEDPEDYLVLQHPLTRIVTSISPRREGISPEFLALKKQINVLIIASNTSPDIPGADREARKLYEYLARHEFISVTANLLTTEEASYDAVRAELSKPGYDIIHYCGHGSYSNASPERSSLFFWEKTGKQGRRMPMAATELTELLRNSEARFVYLSCCHGTETSPDPAITDDFLGLADAAIQSGVPSVLGFRAPVSDESSINLCLGFYKSLLRRGQLDSALWDARRELASRNRNDPTWLSPILISQY